MSEYVVGKSIWEVVVGDVMVVDDIKHTVTDISNVKKPNAFVIVVAEDDGKEYQIDGGRHDDMYYEVL